MQHVKQKNPFQFGLRSLLAILTVAAVFLALLEMMDRPGVLLVIAVVIFLPFSLYSRWWLRSGLPTTSLLGRAAIYLFGVGLIVAAITFLLLVLRIAGFPK